MILLFMNLLKRRDRREFVFEGGFIVVVRKRKEYDMVK